MPQGVIVTAVVGGTVQVMATYPVMYQANAVCTASVIKQKGLQSQGQYTGTVTKCLYCAIFIFYLYITINISKYLLNIAIYLYF